MKWALELRPSEAHGLDNDAEALIDRALGSRGRLSEGDSNRVRDAIEAWIAAAGKRSLEDCLGLKLGPDGKPPAYHLAHARRARAMVTAYQAQFGVTGMSHWERCKKLGDEIVRFECDQWPIWSEAGRAPEGCSRQNAAFYDAFAAVPGQPPAKSARGIHELLKRRGVSGVSEA